MGFQQGFRINTNTASLDTYRSYSAAQSGLETNIERLSSGLRINKAADDAAGLSISNRMDNQVRGMQQANRNVQQGNNMLQTAEGGLNEISNILGRMRELAVQSASDGVNGDDRASIDLEFQQLKAEITRISDATEYNGHKMLDNNMSGTVAQSSAMTGAATFAISGGGVQGAYSFSTTASNDVISLTLTASDGRSESVALTGGATSLTTTGANKVVQFTSMGITVENTGTAAAAFSSFVDTADSTTLNVLDGSTSAGTDGVSDTKYFTLTAGANIQVGANNVAAEDRLGFSIDDHRADQKSGLNLQDVSLDDLANSQAAINSLDTAIDKVNSSRSHIGSMQNRFEFASSNLMNSVQNNSASMSTIRDADFAAEAADLAKNQILVQSGTAMLAQANGLSQNVLALIR